MMKRVIGSIAELHLIDQPLEETFWKDIIETVLKSSEVFALHSISLQTFV